MPTPRELWAQMQPETPFSRYPVPTPRPSPGVAGLVQSIGQGAANAIAYRRQLEANLAAKAEAVAELEAKRLQEAALQQAKQAAELEQQKLRDKGEVDRQNALFKHQLDMQKTNLASAEKRAGMMAGRSSAADAKRTEAQQRQQQAKLNAMWGEKTKAFKTAILGLVPATRAGQLRGGKSFDPEYSLTPEQRKIRSAIIAASQFVVNGDSPDMAMNKALGNMGGLAATTYITPPKGITTTPIHDAEGRLLGYQTERGMNQNRALQAARDYLEELAIGRDNILGTAAPEPAVDATAGGIAPPQTQEEIDYFNSLQ